MCMPIWKFIEVFVFVVFDPVAGQPALPWQPFCAALDGERVLFMLAPEYKVVSTTRGPL